MSRVTYQIRVAGAVPDRVFDDFDRVTLVFDPVGTTLRADVTDLAELNGLRDALRRYGLEILAVRHEQTVEDTVDRT